MDNHNISFQSNQSRKSSISHANIKKKQKIEPYISPFILNAKRTAEERARKAMKILKPKENVPVYNEWDTNTRTPGYFDPELRKQEIFKIEPRKPPKQGNRLRESDNEESSPARRPAQSSPRSVTAKVESSPEERKMTMRTQGVTPSRNPVRREPYRPNPNLVRADHPFPVNRQHPTSRSLLHNDPIYEDEQRPPNQQNHQMVSEGVDPIPEITVARNPNPSVTKTSTAISPMDEKVINGIYEEGGKHPDAKEFSFFVPKEQNEAVQPPPPPSQEQAQPQQQHQQPFSKRPTLEEFLRERLQNPNQQRPVNAENANYYGELIRERLRMLLNRSRRAPFPPNDANDYYYPSTSYAPPPPGVPPGYYHPPPGPINNAAPPPLDPTQLYTRDMMASMASIMTAVGDILTNTSHKQYWAKRKHHRSKSREVTAEELLKGNKPRRSWEDADIQQPSSSSPRHPQQSQQVAPSPTSSTTSSLQKFKPSNASSSSPPPNLNSKIGTRDFMLEMGQAIFQHQKEEGLTKKNKAKVVDLIMQKLQAIEKTENELAMYLKNEKHRRKWDVEVIDDDDHEDDEADEDLHDYDDKEGDEELKRFLQDKNEVEDSKQYQLVLMKKSKAAKKSRDANHHNLDEEVPLRSLPSIPLDVTKENIRRIQDKKRKQEEETREPVQIQVLKQFPSLRDIACDRQDEIHDFIKELDEAKRYREIVYEKKDTTMTITMDTVTDILFDRMLYSVAGEVEHVLDDYAEKLVDKI